jgi:hypothetical protein
MSTPNTHLVASQVINFVTVFAIYFVDRKYKVNSWIDISILFDSSEIYIFKVEFSYFSIYKKFFFKEFELLLYQADNN